MATRVNLDGAVRKLHALANVLKRPLRDVLDSGARTCATRLAYGTQPFGSGADAKLEGEKAVRRDILRVYGNAGRAFEALSGQRKKQFWFLYKSGKIEQAENVARAGGLNIGKFDGGAAHHAVRRARRPRVPQSTRPFIYIIDPGQRKKLDRYIETIQDNVGTVKGGWADCVRAIGGTRGGIRGLKEDGGISASWITAKRKGGGAGAAYRSGSDEHPRITIENRVPNAEQALSDSARRDAIAIARERMIENLQTAVSAEARNLRSAA